MEATAVAPDGADPRLVMTPAEVAAALGVDVNETYEKLRNGTAPFPVRRFGRKWLIPRAAFMRWLEAGGNDGATAAPAAGTASVATPATG